MEIVRTGVSCPECAQPLSRVDDDAPWCTACEWNLLASASKLATRWDRALYQEFSAQRPVKPGWNVSRVVLVAVSVLLWLVPLGLLVWGGWLLAAGSWLVGVLVLVPAVVLRPRLGRLPTKDRRLRREQAPRLFELVDRVAAAAGAPVPDVITVSSEFNAHTYRAGFRRSTAVNIGTYLFATLAPQQRVALLAHELGHQVNGDPTRSLLVQPAFTTFSRLAAATGGHQNLRQLVFGEERAMAAVPVLFVMYLVGQLFVGVQVLLAVLGLRDHQRAEYLADGVAVDVAGSKAAAELMDRLAQLRSVALLMAYRAESKGPQDWAGMAAEFHAARAGQVEDYRQHTVRESEIWDSHPPSGLRARMVEAWPQKAPAFVLSERESAAIDGELSRWYQIAHRRLTE